MSLNLLVLACRGTGYAAINTLLAAGTHRVVGILTEDYPGQVNDGITADTYRQLAAQHGIPFWQTDQIHDDALVRQLSALQADIGLSIGWRRLVREPVISLPLRGFYNFHTSDLPRYRGFASTSWAILRGDERIAITAHRMVDGCADEGDIWLKRYIPIAVDTCIGGLFREVEAVLPAMVLEFLNGVEDGSLAPQPQDETLTLLSYPRHPEDGWIDWNASATVIDRLVRSVAQPYPGAFTCWKMRRVTIWKGHVVQGHPPFVGVPGHVVGSRDGASIDVLTGEGIYCIERIELDNDGCLVPPATIIKGMQQRLGLTPGRMFELLSALPGIGGKP